MILDGALDARRLNKVVHAVQRPQHGGLATPRRADERGDLMLGDVERDIADSAELAVVHTDVPEPEYRRLGAQRRTASSEGISICHNGRDPLGRSDERCSGCHQGTPEVGHVPTRRRSNRLRKYTAEPLNTITKSSNMTAVAAAAAV